MEFNHGYARNKKCLKSLIQGAFALVYNVMAGWLVPHSIKRFAHAVGAALLKRFNTQ